MDWEHPDIGKTITNNILPNIGKDGEIQPIDVCIDG